MGSLLHKCLHHTDFLSTEHFKVKHGFLEHQNDRKDVPFEDKPIDLSKHWNIVTCEIWVNSLRNMIL